LMPTNTAVSKLKTSIMSIKAQNLYPCGAFLNIPWYIIPIDTAAPPPTAY
jgi:hypothetical protein